MQVKTTEINLLSSDLRFVVSNKLLAVYSTTVCNVASLKGQQNYSKL